MKTLADLRVLDFSGQIAGPYCSKLFVDAGAQVIKIEPKAGDPMRHWSTTPDAPHAEDGALFTFLNAGKKSVQGEPSDPSVQGLIAEADLIIAARGLQSDAPLSLDLDELARSHPHLVILSITPYGRTGPWADRLATEFTLQAESGSIGVRGLLGQEPFQAGGRIGEWAAGVYGAVASLPAVLRAQETGHGELIDLSILETSNMIFTNFSESLNRLMNGSPTEPEHAFITQSVETPSIEPSSDGYVGFCTNSRQQFSDFLLMIERVDLQEDEQLAQFAGRLMRFDEWNEIIRAWMTQRPSEEIIELASLLRIPVAPICNGETVKAHTQLEERGVFQPSAKGDFVQPRRPYRFDDTEPSPPSEAPALGADTPKAAFEPRLPKSSGVFNQGQGRPASNPDLPLSGIRILDMTAWWAGPSATHLLATLGAEVIHVESTGRPDGMRLVGGMLAAHYEDWWETSAHYLAANSNKLDITLDLTKPEGIRTLESLIERCDGLIENYTPRVLENFGLTWERVRTLNPNLLLMRMPAFGLSGPWRDNTGFAQTMEQLSGMAWITGHRDDQPRIPRGPCDPLAGMHGAFAFLVALSERTQSGHGHHIESTMVESALNVAAEQVIEWSAYGHLMQRQGNRSPLAAPQGLYPTLADPSGASRWLALSVSTDAEWRALIQLLGHPEWSAGDALQTAASRHQAHDEIDRHLVEWTSSQDAEVLAQALRSVGIAASEVVSPARILDSSPQLQSRGYFETPEHPVVGAMPVPTLPFRYGKLEHWLRTPAPTLGQHNEEVLAEILGLSQAEREELEAAGIIGSRLEGH